jgi:hypothetical protein
MDISALTWINVETGALQAAEQFPSEMRREVAEVALDSRFLGNDGIKGSPLRGRGDPKQG